MSMLCRHPTLVLFTALLPGLIIATATPSLTITTHAASMLSLTTQISLVQLAII